MMRILKAMPVIALLLLSGCRASGTERVKEELFPTLRMLTIGTNGQAALDRISAAVSEITIEKLGCRIQLENLSLPEYGYKMDNLLYDSSLPDMLVCIDRRTLRKLTDGQYVARLDRLLKDYDSFTEQISQNAWQSTLIKGYCYGLPFGNPDIRYWGFLMRGGVCDRLGIVPEEVENLDDLYRVLHAVRDNTGMIPVVSNYGSIGSFHEYDPLDNGIGVFIYGREDEYPINLAESVEFSERVELIRQWYVEGLILEDAAFDNLNALDRMKYGNGFGCFTDITEYTVQDAAWVLAEEVYAVRLGSYIQDRSASPEMICISAFTANRALCMRFLELLYSDANMREIFVYGEMGTDYTLNEDGKAFPLERMGDGNVAYLADHTWPLRAGVRSTASFTGLEGNRFWQPEEVQVSPAYDFIFDSSPVKSELYQCGQVTDKYLNILTSGMADPKKIIPMLNTELKDAGMNAVLNEISIQLNKK